MSGRKFLKEWQVTDKIIESIFYNLYFTNESNSRNNNS